MRPFIPVRGAQVETVLLNAVEDQAKNQGWAVISETAGPGFIERITHQHLPLLLRNLDPEAVRKRLSGFDIPLGPLGSAGADWDTVRVTSGIQTGLRNQIDLLTDLLAADGLGLLDHA